MRAGTIRRQRWQHAEAQHALRMEYYGLAIAHLYRNGQPPAPFTLAIVGYPADPKTDTVKPVGGVWKVAIDRNQRPLVREIDPDVESKLAGGVWYTDGEQPAYQLPAGIRAGHLAKAYAQERPEVGVWVVLEVTHAPTIAALLVLQPHFKWSPLKSTCEQSDRTILFHLELPSAVEEMRL